MARFALTNACFRPLLVAAALTPATYAAQAQDYRLTETTHACDDWRLVKSANSNQTTIRGNRNCGPAPEGRDVRLIRWSGLGEGGQGVYALVDFCASDGCIRRWVLSSLLAPTGSRPGK